MTSKQREKAKEDIKILKAQIRYLDDNCRNLMNLVFKIEDSLLQEEFEQIIKKADANMRGVYVRDKR